MKKLIDWILFRIEMSKMTKELKPLLVRLYNHFSGDQLKILTFIKKKQTAPQRQILEELENVDMEDYLVFTQMGKFDRYCKKNNIDVYHTLVIKKGELPTPFLPEQADC